MLLLLIGCSPVTQTDTPSTNTNETTQEQSTETDEIDESDESEEDLEEQEESEPLDESSENDTESSSEQNSNESSDPEPETTPEPQAEESTAPSVDKVLTYSESNLDKALATGNKVVLYFAADWCPTCRALDTELKDKVSEIPDDLIIVRADYGTENELSKKYEVTYQHTFVWLDKDEEQIKKWQGGGLKLIKQQIGS